MASSSLVVKRQPPRRTAATVLVGEVAHVTPKKRVLNGEARDLPPVLQVFTEEPRRPARECRFNNERVPEGKHVALVALRCPDDEVGVDLRRREDCKTPQRLQGLGATQRR
jgi:hypothetical protein